MDMLVKRTFVLVSLVIISFILSGCHQMVNQRKEAEEIVATVIECINEEDYESLNALFCDEVSENYDLDSEADDVFNMFDSEITSYEIIATPSGHKSEFGKSSYSITPYVDVCCDNREFRINIGENIYNDFEPQRIGIYSIMVMDKDVKERIYIGENPTI